MNIILDMDETLISAKSIFGMTPYDITSEPVARPYLKEFLDYCFKNFKNVSIWTAADEEWFAKVDKIIFQPYFNICIEQISVSKANLVSNENKFDFVFTRKNCGKIWKYNEYFQQSEMFIEKRIRKLHNSKKRYIDYTMDNTIIVDDTKTTFQNNYGNGILIEPFNHNDYSDNELKKLLSYFDQILIPHYSKYKTVRNLEKRWWINDIN